MCQQTPCSTSDPEIPQRTLAVPSPMARAVVPVPRRKGLGRRFELLADAPVALKRLTNLVAGRIGHDQLRTGVLAVHNRVLAEGSSEIEGFVAFDAVDDPRRFTPNPLGFLFEAHAVLDTITPQNQQIAHDL